MGKLIILAAPSGSGKSTVARHLLAKYPNLQFSVSATTRSPRGNEEDGKDYYFLSLKEFKKKIKNGDFVEHEEVYPNQFYGTLKEEVERIWASGKDVVFDIDVKGGISLKNLYGKKALLLFVQAPSFEILEERLRARKTDSEENIQIRLDKIKEELKYAELSDHILFNDVLDDTLKKAEELVEKFLNDGK